MNAWPSSCIVTSWPACSPRRHSHLTCLRAWRPARAQAAQHAAAVNVEAFGTGRRALLAAAAALLGAAGAQCASAAVPLSTGPTPEQRARALSQIGGETAHCLVCWEATPVEQRAPGRCAHAQPRHAGRAALPPRPAAEPAEDPSARVHAALGLLKQASEASAAGEYAQALEAYSQLARGYPELALAERARAARGPLLYQLGDVAGALAVLSDEEAALRGSAEVHAALAAILYAERPGQLGRAEQQWDIATEFDARYADPEWVAANKRWPPRLLAALRRFLSLSQ